MITERDILEDMYKAVNGICDKVYLRERPASTSDSVNSFIVCYVPSAIYNDELSDDGDYDMFSTTVQFEVYVRDKVSASNINRIDINTMDDKVREVLSLFPLKAEHCVFMNPIQTLKISDGKQFHCSIIQADTHSI